MVDSVPADIAKSLHPDVIIAVNINQECPKATPFFAQSVYNRAYAIMGHRLTLYSGKQADVIIRPHVGLVSTFDLSKKTQLYREGGDAAYKMVPKIKAQLKKHGIK